MVAFKTGWFEIEFEIISLAILNKFLTAFFTYIIIVLVWKYIKITVIIAWCGYSGVHRNFFFEGCVQPPSQGFWRQL